MYFNPKSPSGYDELVTFYPVFYREVAEMEAIWKTEGSYIDSIKTGIERIFSNSFIDTADEEMIAKFEEFLGSYSYKNKSLEERRRIVKAIFAGSGKMSSSVIIGMIKSFNIIGEPDVELAPCDDAGNNMLYVSFNSAGDSASDLEAIQEILAKKMPAHIPAQITSIYEAEPQNTEIYLNAGMGISEFTTELPTLLHNFDFDTEASLVPQADNIGETILPVLNKTTDFKARISVGATYKGNAESTLPVLTVEPNFVQAVDLSSVNHIVSETIPEELKEV